MDESSGDEVGDPPRSMDDTDHEMPAFHVPGAQKSNLLTGLLLLLMVAAGVLVAISVQNRNESPPVATETDFPKSPESFSPSPEEPSTFPSALTSLSARNFSISYPSGWVVQQLEVTPAGTNYLDTSIRRTAEDPNFLIRIDMLPTPHQGSSVDRTIEALREKAGFELLDRDEEPLYAAGGTYPAETMEFLLLNTDTGVMMRSIDTFFVDEQGRSFALLTRTPAGVWNTYEEVLQQVRESINPR